MDGATRNRALFLALSAALAVAVLVWARQVLLPFVLALVVAYVLTPAVARVERLRVRRWMAVIAVYAVTLGALYGASVLTAPRLVAETRALLSEAPKIAATIRDRHLPAVRRWIATFTSGEAGPEPESAEPTPPSAVRVTRSPDGSYDIDFGAGIEVEQLGGGRWRVTEISGEQQKPLEVGRLVGSALERTGRYIRNNTLEALRVGQLIVGTISRAIFVFFMTLMLAAYMMVTRERILGFFRSLVFPAGRASFDWLLLRIDRGLSGVVRGQLLICLINGVLSAIGFACLGLKYWPILALLAAAMSIVPIFGSILSSIPIVAIALTQSVTTALWVLLWIIGIHQLEANFLNPKIIGDAARIHPVLVVFSLLVGEHFFGVAGALLAVPVLSVLQSVFLHFRNVVYGDDAPKDSLMPPRPVL
jgi:predicted PurR-regulated permease PerM